MSGDEEEPQDPVGSSGRKVSPASTKRRDALRLLIKARENLISQMAEEIVSNRDAILGDLSQTGLFGFEFQEIEDRYIGRLNAINSILDNLEVRAARIVNKTEVVYTTRKRLKDDLDELIARYDQWDVVSVNAIPAAIPEKGKVDRAAKGDPDGLMLIVAFTADEYSSDEDAPEGNEGDREI
jgi:hypothetical protein